MVNSLHGKPEIVDSFIHMHICNQDIEYVLEFDIVRIFHNEMISKRIAEKSPVGQNIKIHISSAFLSSFRVLSL